MTTYLALNKKQLSQLRYHPLWGLGRANNTKPTCYDDAVCLQKNSDIKQAIIKQINQVSRWPWLVRALFWMLNIKNYRVHYYQLLSYASLSIYQAGIKTMSEHQQEQINRVGGFLIVLTGFALGLAVFSSLRPDLIEVFSDWFKQRLAPFVAPEIELYSPDIEEQSCCLLRSEDSNVEPRHNNLREIANQADRLSFSPRIEPAADIPAESTIHDDISQHAANQATIVVTSGIIASLNILGIKTAIDDMISFQEIKKAYQKQVLRTHPDKTRADTQQAFLAVMDAYQIIMKSFAQQKHESNNEVSFNDFYEHEMEEWAKLREEIDRFGQEVKEVAQKVKKVAQEVETLRNDVAQFGLRLEEGIQYYKKQNEEASARNKALGLPDLTDEEVDEFVKDPVKFTIKIRQRDADMLQKRQIQSNEPLPSNTMLVESDVNNASCRL